MLNYDFGKTILKNDFGAKTMSDKKFRERKDTFKTDSGIEIQPFYTPNENFSYEESLGNPGKSPYTRGVQPTMYRGRFWTMRQYAGFASAEESNKRYRYLLEQGTTGLSVAFDLPTQMGYDSDDSMSFGEVGKVGVAIDSLKDMEILFDQIPLEKISTSMTINSTASILLCLYIAVAKKQGADISKLSGTIQNDILKEYIARGTYIFPPTPSMRIITDIFEYCSKNLPNWNTISISGYHIREAGSTAVQELAFTFANAIAYVESAIKAGLDVDVFGKRLSFFFNCHNNLFEEVAKFRAARRIWVKILTEKFQAKDPKTTRLRFHTQTAGSTLTAQQPDNNVVRVTLQALAACLGGTQSLHTNSKDEALALPTEASARLALRTQQIVAYESGAADTIDPLAGSYFVENLTDEIETKTWEYLNKIEKMGGSIPAIESQFFQREIADSAYRYQIDIEKEEKIIVGVNKFQMEEEPQGNLLRIDESVAEQQIQKLKELKASRDNEKVANLLSTLEATAKSDKNLLPVILECVENYVTLGEISHCLRGVFGVYKE